MPADALTQSEVPARCRDTCPVTLLRVALEAADTPAQPLKGMENTSRRSRYEIINLGI
jgi:hypothetical protein